MLCDTNGGMLPAWMGEVVSAAGAVGVDLGIHCHNDTGCAVANTLAAVDAGAMHVQGTMNGHGERTGNADLITIAANLQLKYGWPVMAPENLARATSISHAVAAITHVAPNARQPYVGQSAFAHKAGLHASAIKVDANLSQHIDPTLVGNDMRMLVSDMAGRANIQLKGEELGYDLSDRDLAGRITDTVKQREMDGYSYESADASFELLLRGELGLSDDFFEVLTWRVFTGHEMKPEGDSEATVKLRVQGENHAYVGEGHGPLNALAAQVVEGLDPFRAPLTEAEMARRNPDRLTPRQRALLDAWGYPYVLDEFRFHMTLTGALDPATLDAVTAQLGPRLTVVPRPFTLDAISLMGEDASGRVHLIRRLPL